MQTGREVRRHPSALLVSQRYLDLRPTRQGLDRCVPSFAKSDLLIRRGLRPDRRPSSFGERCVLPLRRGGDADAEVQGSKFRTLPEQSMQLLLRRRCG